MIGQDTRIIGNATLILGDCREVLKSLESCSIDSVVSDPPAGIAFQNCKWDSDKGGRNNWIGWMQEIAAECLRVTKPGSHALVWALPRTSHWTATAWENAGWDIRDRVAHIFGNGMPKSHNLKGDWEGWGSALKPSMEDWWLFRKPLAGTIAQNVQTYGAGAINIDGCRVGVGEGGDREGEGSALRRYTQRGSTNFSMAPGPRGGDSRGRWPSHLTHDGSEEVLAIFPESKGQQGAVTGQEPSGKTNNVYGQYGGRPATTPRGDSGSASRFFYCSKATSDDRGEGNSHPCVKSSALMRYLCRLITPPNGLILDPFSGSASTGKGALHEGFRYIGIEQSPEYHAIACDRLSKIQEPQQVILPMAEAEPDLFGFSAA